MQQPAGCIPIASHKIQQRSHRGICMSISELTAEVEATGDGCKVVQDSYVTKKVIINGMDSITVRKYFFHAQIDSTMHLA